MGRDTGFLGSASAHAKINLSLTITGKRPDGYHEIESLMAPLTLCDEVSLFAGEPGSGITVSCPFPGVPEDASNLAVRAARLFFRERAGGGDIFIRIEKAIPPGAGLGGGSSDAAAVLSLLNRVYGKALPDEALFRMASSLGADVPFFLLGRPALARGIGEILTPVSGVRPYFVVLVHPGFPLSTAEVYGRYKFTLTRPGKIHRLRVLKDGPDGGARVETGPTRLSALLSNDLTAPACEVRPELYGVIAAVAGSGALGALMTGSGSAVFGLFDDAGKARAAREALLGAHPSWTVFLTRILS